MFLVPNPACIPRKYLPASRVFLFHNTRLLSPDRVRCTIIKIFNSPAFHSRVWLPRSKIFSTRVISSNTPPPSTHTHTKTSSGVRAHAHTPPPSLETLARSPPPPQGLHCQHLPVCPCSLPTDLHTQAALSFLDDACQTPPFPQIPIPIPHSRASQPKPGYASRGARGATGPKEVYRGLFARRRRGSWRPLLAAGTQAAG